MNFYNELATATGTDDSALAAWLGQYVADDCYAGLPGALCLRRAAAYWDAADESMQAAIGAMIGFTEPSGERWPVPDGVANDFKVGVEWAYTVIGEPA